MLVPIICKICNSLYGMPNPETGMRECRKCGHKKKVECGDILAIDYYSTQGTTTKRLENNDIRNLSSQITTKTVLKKCMNEECKSEYLKQVYDDEYRFILVCPDCKTIFA